MKMVFASVLFLLAFMPADIQAQRVIVNGTVVDEYGEPIAGANVMFDALVIGTSTDANGQYALNLPASQANGQTINLQIFAQGYVRKHKSITYEEGIQTHDFQLQPDFLQLDEQIVTGVSAATSIKNLTYAVGTLEAEDILIAPGSNPVALLQGRVAGASVLKQTGGPGDGYAVRLRGSSSITRDTNPLIIVDGVILGDGVVDIEALDIERVEVVKGAAAAAAYGSRAQDGIVHIKTYRGRNLPLNQLRVTVRNEFGINDLEQVPETNQSHNLSIGADGSFLDANDNVIEYGPGTVIDREANGVSFYDNPFAGETYNAFEQFFKQRSTYSNYISLSQNGVKTNVYGSLSNVREAGILTTLKGYDRQTARVNLDHQVLQGLSFSASAQFARSSNDSPVLSSAGSLGLVRFNPFQGIAFTNPYSNLQNRDEDGAISMLADPLATVENPL